MNILDAVLLGILQGVTEFLPVSSSGHLVIAQHMIKGFEQPGVLFDVVLHFGTLLSVLIYFRRDISDIILSIFKKDAGMGEAFNIIAGTIPTVIIALTLKEVIEGFFTSVRPVGIMLIITGFLLYLSSKVKQVDKKNVSMLDAILIGTAQGVALIPGISRSGITISAALLRGIDAKSAGRFSFLLSIPAIIGAVVLESRHIQSLDFSNMLTYFIGAMFAFIVGVISIRLLMFVLVSGKFSFFAYYCWIAGTAVLLLT